MDLERISRGLKATFGARIAFMAASGLLTVVLTRFLLTSEEYGLLGTAVAVVGVAQLFGDLGIAKSAARFVTEYREREPGQTPYVLRAAFAFRLGAALLVGGAVFAFADPLAALVGQPAVAPLLALGAAYLAAYSLFSFSQVVFQGYNRVTYSAAIQATGAVARLVFAVAFVALLGGAAGAMVGYAVGYGLAAVVGVALLYRNCYRGVERAAEPEPGLARRLARYSVPLTATRGANVLDKRVDTILVGYFATPVAVGYYYLAKQIVGFVQAPAASLGFTLSPTYGEQKAGGDTDEAARLYETALEHTLLLYVPAAAGLLLVADPAVRLIFGADYAGAAPVLQVFSVFVVLQAVAYITSDALDFLGRARSRAYAKGVTSVANVALNVALIPAYGAAGAAAATVVTFGAYTAVNVWVIHSELSLSVGRLVRHLAATVGVAAGMSVAVYLALTAATGALAVAVAVPLGVAVWAALSVAGGLLDPRRVTALL